MLDTGIRASHAEFRYAPGSAPPGGGGEGSGSGSDSSSSGGSGGSGGSRGSGGKPPTRVGAGFNAVEDGGSVDDCHGHGTHVAAVVGGLTYGVAKNVTLHPVKVGVMRGRGSEEG